jgi:hypothetical protein
VHRFPTTKLRAPRNAADAIARPRLEALLDVPAAATSHAPDGARRLRQDHPRRLLGARQGPAPAWFTVDPGDDPGDGDAPTAEARATAWLRAALDAARRPAPRDDDVDDGASDPSATRPPSSAPRGAASS